MEYKTCTKCECLKPIVDFRLVKERILKNGRVRAAYRHTRCKLCQDEIIKAYEKANLESVKAYRRNWWKEYQQRPEFKLARKRRVLLNMYNVSPDWYQSQSLKGCAICSRTPEELGYSLHVDHDHSCCPGDVTHQKRNAREKSCGHCVRGLLCEDCNRLLGCARDNTEILSKAIAYLNASRVSTDTCATSDTHK